MPRFDFGCSAGHVFTKDVPRDQRSASCPCGKRAERLLSVPYLPGVAAGGRAPTPADQRPLHVGAMQEAAAEVDYAWQKREYEMDRPLERPPYFQVARKKAHDALAGKIAPPEGWSDPLAH